MEQQAFEFDPLKVQLPEFEGPLDLMLHLVRRQELNIQTLRLSDLTDPYLKYVQQMTEMDLDRGGEFLSIAATLIWLKSRAMLPRRFDEEELDPDSVEEMLLLRLQEYQRIKDAAADLAGLDMLGRDLFARTPPTEAPQAEPPLPPVEEVSLYALMEAFRGVLERGQKSPGLHLVPEPSRIEDRVEELLHVLANKKKVLFSQLFELGQPLTREGLVLTFIALLELVRLKALRLVQSQPLGEIGCVVTSTFLDHQEEWKQRILRELTGKKTPAKV